MNTPRMSSRTRLISWLALCTALGGPAALRGQDAPRGEAIAESGPAPIGIGQAPSGLGAPLSVSPSAPRTNGGLAPTALFSRATSDSSFPGATGMRPLPVGPGPDPSPSPSPYTWRSAATSPAPGDPVGAGIPGAGFPGAAGLGGPGGPIPGGPVSSAPIPGGPVPGGGPGCDCSGGTCGDGACGPGCGVCGGGCCDGGACCDGCCAGCCGCWGNCCCYPGNRFYVSGEYLLWFLRGSPLPPLVTSGSAGDTIPGALGAAGTQVLFGGRNYNTGPLSGGRFFVGYWFGPCRKLGIELGGFFLGPRTTSFSATSGGFPILARPFIDAATGQQTVEGVSAPGVLAGTVSSSLYTFLWGTEANLRSNLCCGPNYFIDGIAGFRNVNLYERLRVDESLNVLAGGGGGGSFVINDTFQTHNNFYGGQLGLAGEVRWRRWSVNMFGKVGLGVTQQVVDINGTSVITPPGGTATMYPGGLLAQPSNIGRHSRDVFGVVPEAGINLGYQLTPHLRTFVGYNFLYWNNVVRPGPQIDPVINTAQIPPATGTGNRPLFNFNHSDFWAQGITFGLEFRY